MNKQTEKQAGPERSMATPSTLIPTEAEQDVQTVIDVEPMITDADADQAAKLLGLTKLTSLNLRALSRLGVYVDRFGAVKMSRARTLVTVEQINELLSDVADIVRSSADPQQRINAASVAANLFDKQIKAEANMIKLIEVQPPEQKQQAARNKSFAPQQDVPRVAVQVNIKNGSEDAAK